MAGIKNTIKIGNVRHESATYVGGKAGYTIYVGLENLTAKSIDVEVKEVYLVQDMERAYDYLYAGYLGKKGKILPMSKMSLGRIWYADSLVSGRIEAGNYIVVHILDCTNQKIYFVRFDYDGTKWECIFSDVEKVTD